MSAAVDFEALARAAGSDAGSPQPPVHLWHPDHCGEIDIRIRRDGVWLHQGTPIGRERLVRLFSTILRRDPDGYHLVTPAEKLRIIVDDAPFLAVRLDRSDDVLVFSTNVGDAVAAGIEHPIRVAFDPVSGEPSPYIHVRRGLEARLSRPVFYDLVDHVVAHDGRQGVWSAGAWFPLDRPEDV